MKSKLLLYCTVVTNPNHGCEVSTKIKAIVMVDKNVEPP